MTIAHQLVHLVVRVIIDAGIGPNSPREESANAAGPPVDIIVAAEAYAR
jgi:hypothetical protein